MSTSGPRRRGVNADQLRDAIDRGRTGSKVPFSDPAAAPLGTDEEAAGTPSSTAELTQAMRHEVKNRGRHRPSGTDANVAAGRAPGRRRP